MVLNIKVTEVDSTDAIDICKACGGVVEVINEQKTLKGDIMISVMTFDLDENKPLVRSGKESTPFARYMNNTVKET